MDRDVKPLVWSLKDTYLLSGDFELDFRVGLSSWTFELDFRVGFSSWTFELDFRVGFSSCPSLSPHVLLT